MLRLRARQFNRLNGPGYCHFPIAYQQEFFNQLTSEEVRTRFVRGHPVRYWFKPSGQKKRGLRPPRLRARGAACPPGSLGDAPARRADRTAAAAAVSARGRRPAYAASFIAATRVGKPNRA